MAAVKRNGSLFWTYWGVQDHVQVYKKRKRLALTSTPMSGRPRIKHRISDFSRPRDASLAKPQAVTYMTLVRGCGYDCILVQ